MRQAARSELRTTTGIEDPAEIKRRLDRAEELEKAETERKRADLTAQQKLEQDLATERAAREAAETARDQERYKAHVSRACSANGIKNVDYALFVVGQATEALPDGQTLDVDTHLKGLLEKPEFKSAFGIAADTTVVPAPVTTSPNPDGTPPAPPRGPAVTPPADSMSMTPQQFQAHLATLGAG